MRLTTIPRRRREPAWTTGNALLTDGSDAAWPHLQAIADAVLNARLQTGISAPLAVAFSGGGDSLALLLAAKDWADRAGRRLHALTVDHRLQADGAAWASWCAAKARDIGVAHTTLVWRDDKPATGLPAAARVARHSLIATAARELGAAVVMLGHTADDRWEADWMRQAGGTTPDPRVWSPSPIWPEGRNLYILRPWINVRRAAIRAGLTERGETWIEDPSNCDPAQARARARLSLIGPGPATVADDDMSSALFEHIRERQGGELTIDAEAALGAPAQDARRAIAAMLLCAAGTSRPPRGARLSRLMGLIDDRAAFIATLAGARICSDGSTIRIMRDAGESKRRPSPDVSLPKETAVVFDGRFEVIAARAGLHIGLLRGRAASLHKAERSMLRTLSPDARGACPVAIGPDGMARLVLADNTAEITVRSLITPRLAGALGVIICESHVTRVAKTVGTS